MNRTRRVLLGSGTLLFAKIFNVVSLILLTGMASRYLSAADFGLWAILTNLPAFAATFDLGLGNTLRNKMAVLSAASDAEDASRVYFFACFTTFLFFAFAVIASVTVFFHWIPWYRLFSFSAEMTGHSWPQACGIAIAVLALYFPFSLGISGFYAFQETHWTAVFEMLRGVLVCTGLAIAIGLHASFLTLVALFFGCFILAMIACWSYFLIRRSWSMHWPTFAEWKKVIRDLGPKSTQFAILQMSAGIILLTDALLVGWISGLADAGDYSIVQRLYSFIIATESLMLTPLWSAYTQAHERKERAWVLRQLKRSAGATLLLIVGGCLACWIAGPWVIKIWTYKTIHWPSLYLAMTAWIVVYGISHCFSVYLNAIGRLRRQTVLAGIAGIANIPLALWLGRMWGAPGVCWAGVFCILPSTLSNPLETYLFVRATNKE